ncbi:hypothetical protein [Ideonella sp.]|uniref:hypothetical protein n=1 Tax=Ideonella sp. TaxID=1929293 RepID=UPI002E356EF8|nr:hypothetical protein [Ideonella sp.]
MLITDKVVFVELQKTGSTHIKNLLKETLGGKNDGKHNVPTPELLSSGREFLGSVRDPWGWYLSLWSYGCQQQGKLYQRLTNPKRWERVQPKLVEARKVQKEKVRSLAAGQGPKKWKPILIPDRLGVDRAKNFYYKDPADAEAFREWLRLVCSPYARRLVEDGFAKSPLGKLGGLMTFRYFSLFVPGSDEIPPTISTQKMLRKFEADRVAVKHIVRQHTLADDLVHALDSCQIVLTDKQREKIYEAKPTNKSTRPHPFAHYYDVTSIDIVAKREKFIIDRFGYERPNVA